MKIKISESASINLETVENEDGSQSFVLYKGGIKMAFADPERDKKRNVTGYIVNWAGSGNVTPDDALEFARMLDKLVGHTRRAPKGKMK